MKKYISLFLAVLMLFSCIIPFSAFAAESTEDDAYFTQAEFEALEHLEAEYMQTRATGLITSKRLAIGKSGSNLVISGYTYGTTDVVRTGFSKLTIERKKASATSWSTYKTYTSLYSDSARYNLGKTVAVEAGYQYRVTGTHYAKKSLLSTEKIDAATGALTF
ncbi:MAG: hypothetical protein K2L36_02340 [Eubacterium sp.]|nr:hypothetical protein [Eubacterium sp.]